MEQTSASTREIAADLARTAGHLDTHVRRFQTALSRVGGPVTQGVKSRPSRTGVSARALAQFRAMETHRSIVIVPSRTIDKFHVPAAETQAYEERLLCLLLML
jgi:hypothetical protein